MFTRSIKCADHRIVNFGISLFQFVVVIEYIEGQKI